MYKIKSVNKSIDKKKKKKHDGESMTSEMDIEKKEFNRDLILLVKHWLIVVKQKTADVINE